MTINETIIYILLQELFENDLLDLDKLEKKYYLNKNQIKKIKDILTMLYGKTF